MTRKNIYLIGLLGLILAAYSNTFQASWHLDDYNIIVHNDRLHLSKINLQTIDRTLFLQNDDGEAKLYRPVACLSFGVNWYFTKDNVFGYHVVNIVIHLLTALFLFLTTKLLLCTPNTKKKYQQSAFFIALLSTAFWALNPIQTQAVTYIVQRMAAMAAMFYILAIFFYVKARVDESVKQRFIYISGCLVCYLLALGSKENAAMLPLTLVLVEIVFFQDLLIALKQNKKLVQYLCVAGVVVILSISIGLALVQKNPLTGLTNLYESRSFTLTERLLTQFRVILFYITQLFYPIPQRLSIDHEVVVSTSFFTPWTTLPSIILVAAFVFIGFLLIRKKPLPAFAILFYFLNHIIESSILPLELLFEHRNYLPSFFIFLPVSSGLLFLLDKYRNKNRLIYRIIFGFIIFLPCFFASGTFIRNMAWKTEKSLWTDALDKAPNSSRSAYSLANDYFKRTNGLDTAMALYKKSFALASAKPSAAKALTLNGIAGIHYIRQDYKDAVFYSRKALDIAPYFEVIRHGLVQSLFATERFDEASNNLDILLLNNNRNIRYLILKSVALAKLEKPEEALVYLREALKLQPANADILLHVGKTFFLMGDFEKAEWFFKRASEMTPNNIDIRLFLIEISIRQENDTQLNDYFAQLFSRNTIEQVCSHLKHNRLLTPSAVEIENDLLIPVISNYLSSIAMDFDRQAN